jgi:hypothetical protein
MPNDSSTGGYLTPAATPAPLEGQALLRFFQGIIAGVSGLPGNMVRPYWQTEPPNIPDAGVAWAAFRITRRPSDEYPFVGHYFYAPTATVDYHLQRHEELVILVTFYDIGSTGLNNSGGTADDFAALFRDGIAIEQNREPLILQGMNLVRVGDLITVPVVFKQRWQYRVDFEFSVRRQIDRIYPVNTLVSATGTLYTDTGLPPEPFSASANVPPDDAFTSESGAYYTTEDGTGYYVEES